MQHFFRFFDEAAAENIAIKQAWAQFTIFWLCLFNCLQCDTIIIRQFYLGIRNCRSRLFIWLLSTRILIKFFPSYPNMMFELLMFFLFSFFLSCGHLNQDISGIHMTFLSFKFILNLMSTLKLTYHIKLALNLVQYTQNRTVQTKQKFYLINK